ncbi:MAG: LacI family DNA-binding transcriptional regulator [Pirellulales bacterium]
MSPLWIMTPTIEDVARRAKVSISTVSRVLNRPGMVRQDTRERVEQAIVQLGFRPNAYAQGLMRSRSDLPNLGGQPRRRK